MLRLLLLRHAKSVPATGAQDKNRVLESSGRRAAAQAGAWIQERDLIPDLALVSDAQRTRETFAYMAEQFKRSVPVRYDPRIYNAEFGALLDLIRLTQPTVGVLLLVGHNPGLSDLATTLAGSCEPSARASLGLGFPTGAVASFSFDGAWRELAPRSARLEAVYRNRAD